MGMYNIILITNWKLIKYPGSRNSLSPVSCSETTSMRKQVRRRAVPLTKKDG
jgi:hypothetical protein